MSESLESTEIMYDPSVPPDHPASVWTENGWERVVATIMEDGSLRLMPDNICPKCVLLLTEAEWAAFPQPPNQYYKWDFTAEKWVDKRDPARLRKEAGLRIRNVFEAVRWRAWGAYIPDFETTTWPGQVREAEGWLNDQAYPTPGIDAYLEELGSEAPEKAEFARVILENDIAFRAQIMRVNARQRLWINRIYTCADNAATDMLMAELEAFDLDQRKAVG